MIRFGLLGFPVTVHGWFWLSAALLSGSIIGSSRPDAIFLLLIWLGVVFLSLLWHELGHALASRRCGRSPEIVLQAFGGCTVTPSAARFEAKQSVMVALAGPVFSFLLWLAVYACLRLNLIPSSAAESWGVILPAEVMPFGLREALRDFQVVNLWWTLLNLIPAGSLDGGKIVSALLGPGKSREAQVIGVVSGGMAALFAFVAGHPFLSLFLGFMAYENLQKLERVRQAGGAFGRGV